MTKSYKLTFHILILTTLLSLHTISVSALENGIALDNLSANTNDQQFETLEVPLNASELSFSVSGGSGDVDLYVRFGSPPTLRSFDCRPYQNGNQETCNINNAQAGTYYVMLVAYNSYSDVELLASYSLNNNPINEGTLNSPILLEKGVAKENLSGTQGSTTFFMLPITADASNLSVQISGNNGSGNNGDADLYLRYNQAPSANNYDCRPYINGSNETCNISDVMAGNYYVMIQGYSDYNNLRLIANFDDGTFNPTPEPPTTGCINAVQQELLDAHNAARTQARSCGDQSFAAAQPLQWNCQLGEAASSHSEDMAINGILSHTGSNGLSVGDRLNNVGYNPQTWAENIAAGQSSVSNVMQSWLNSPGHCANIMNPNLTEMGGARIESSNGPFSPYWTGVFARPQ